MTDVTMSDLVIYRKQFTLKLPTNAIEMKKALTWAQRLIVEFNPALACYDDALTITADEESVVIWFEYKPPSAAGTA